MGSVKVPTLKPVNTLVGIFATCCPFHHFPKILSKYKLKKVFILHLTIPQLPMYTVLGPSIKSHRWRELHCKKK